MEKGIDYFGEIKDSFGIVDVDVKTYSPLALAFIGDSIYDLVIRSILVGEGNRRVNALHKDKSNLVRACKQAEMADFLEEHLSEEEAEVYKRGKNAKTVSTAKNASLKEYHKATGLEALFGYLYLCGQTERLFTLIRLCDIF